MAVPVGVSWAAFIVRGAESRGLVPFFLLFCLVGVEVGTGEWM